MGKKVLINSVDKVLKFVDITQNISYDIDVKSGNRTFVDGKSILGIMSCDFKQPLLVRVYADEEELDDIYAKFDQFVV